VTYHGVEALTDTIVVAASEGRSYIDAVDVTTGKHLQSPHRCCQAVLRGEDSGQWRR
jgi:hypothetical protein